MNNKQAQDYVARMLNWRGHVWPVGDDLRQLLRTLQSIQLPREAQKAVDEIASLANGWVEIPMTVERIRALRAIQAALRRPDASKVTSTVAGLQAIVNDGILNDRRLEYINDALSILKELSKKPSESFFQPVDYDDNDHQGQD